MNSYSFITINQLIINKLFTINLNEKFNIDFFFTNGDKLLLIFFFYILTHT